MAESDKDDPCPGLQRLLSEIRLGMLATEGAEGPYTSLVGIAPLDGGARIAFATDRDTTKYANLQRNARASLMLDNRAVVGEDLDTVAAATIVGPVAEVAHEERARARGAIEERLPQLSEFLSSANCAVLVLDVDRCHLVSGFQSDEGTQMDT